MGGRRPTVTYLPKSEQNVELTQPVEFSLIYCDALGNMRFHEESLGQGREEWAERSWPKNLLHSEACRRLCKVRNWRVRQPRI